MEKDNKKIITAWAFYDWANSVYPLVITSTTFPIYYLAVTSSKTSSIVRFLGINFNNSALLTYALSFAYLVIAILSPLLSGIADYSGSKKKFMQFFCYLGAASCSLMYFFTSQNLSLGIVLIILACIGYSGSIVFYNAYLPEIATEENQDRVSAKGFAMGYIGSSILLILNLIVVLYPQYFFDVNTKMKEILAQHPAMLQSVAFQQAKDSFAGIASRLGFLAVGIWWIAFAQITFFYVPSNPTNRKPEGNYLFRGYQELVKVWHQLKHTTRLTRFLAAFFVYSMGVQTIMMVATLFGSDTLKLESGQLIITILVIQFVAIAGSYLFSYLSKLIGNIATLKIAVVIWILLCIGAYFTTTATQFYILAGVVGLVMGGIQSLSRSTYSKMLPETLDHASFFSFFDVCEKVGIVLGTALFASITQITSDMRNAVVSLVIIFVVGLLLLIRVPKVKQLESTL
ncbi:MAG TPA: MFS transporter [Bacteroidia bacterium]|nr:MFS transporter [Bacteroidia bacterium]